MKTKLLQLARITVIYSVWLELTGHFKLTICPTAYGCTAYPTSWTTFYPVLRSTLISPKLIRFVMHTYDGSSLVQLYLDFSLCVETWHVHVVFWLSVRICLFETSSWNCLLWLKIDQRNYCLLHFGIRAIEVKSRESVPHRRDEVFGTELTYIYLVLYE